MSFTKDIEIKAITHFGKAYTTPRQPINSLDCHYRFLEKSPHSEGGAAAWNGWIIWTPSGWSFSHNLMLISWPLASGQPSPKFYHLSHTFSFVPTWLHAMPLLTKSWWYHGGNLSKLFGCVEALHPQSLQPITMGRSPTFSGYSTLRPLFNWSTLRPGFRLLCNTTSTLLYSSDLGQSPEIIRWERSTPPDNARGQIASS